MAALPVKQVATYTTGTSASVHTVSISAAPSTGNHLILFFVIAGGRTMTGVTDNAGNTWQVDKTLSNTTNHGLAIASAYLTAVPTSLSATFSSTGVAAAVCHEFSGLDTTAWFDQQNGTAAGNTTTVASGATGLTAGDSLLVAATADGSRTVTSEALSPAWTDLTRMQSTGTIRSIEPTYRIVSGAGTYAYNGTLSASAVHTDAIVAYKVAAAGGGGQTIAIAAAMSASAALTGAAVRTIGVAAPLSASAILTAAGDRIVGISAAASASATLAASGGLIRPLAASLSATATLAAAATVTAGGSTIAADAVLTASASLIAGGDLIRGVTAPLSASASVVAAATAYRGIAAPLSGSASLVAAASLTRSVAAALTASASLAATATSDTVVLGDAELTFPQNHLATLTSPSVYEASLTV